MRVTVLGSSGSFAGPDAACSGYLVEGGGVSVALDLGPGTLSALQRVTDLDGLDAVVLSHEHPDHWADLAGLAVAWRYHLGRDGLPVYGTAGTRARAEVFMGGVDPPCRWTDVDDGAGVHLEAPRGTGSGMTLRFASTVHYVPTLAVRIDADGVSVGYSADTGPSWSLDALGSGLDLALVEATHLADREGEGLDHLSARQAGRMGAAAGVGLLVLTHLAPGVDRDAARVEGSTAFGAPVEVAVDGAVYDIGSPPARPGR